MAKDKIELDIVDCRKIKPPNREAELAIDEIACTNGTVKMLNDSIGYDENYNIYEIIETDDIGDYEGKKVLLRKARLGNCIQPSRLKEGLDGLTESIYEIDDKIANLQLIIPLYQAKLVEVIERIAEEERLAAEKLAAEKEKELLERGEELPD